MKHKIMTLGNGCDAHYFTWNVGINQPGPFDNNFCNLGVEGIFTFLNGEFFKAIQNGDVVKSNPLITEEDEVTFTENVGWNCYPIVKVGKYDFAYVHISYYSFLRHINDRIQSFYEHLNNGGLFAITQSNEEKTWDYQNMERFLNEWGDVFKDRLIVVSNLIKPEDNCWLSTNVPVIDFGLRNMFDFQPFEKKDLFLKYYYLLLDKYPEFKEKLVEPSV